MIWKSSPPSGSAQGPVPSSCFSHWLQQQHALSMQVALRLWMLMADMVQHMPSASAACCSLAASWRRSSSVSLQLSITR